MMSMRSFLWSSRSSSLRWRSTYGRRCGRKWFQLRRPAWSFESRCKAAVLDMVFELLGENLLYEIPRSTNLFFHASSEVGTAGAAGVAGVHCRQGNSRTGHRGLAWWLPAVVAYGIRAIPSELIRLHMSRNALHLRRVLFYNEAADLVLAAAIALLLLRRLVLSIRRQRQLALDVERIQEVQQVLMPKEQPPLPGLTIETVYRPAREVGGDFFQIVQHPDGSALIVAGDVAGKGLKKGGDAGGAAGGSHPYGATDTSLDPAFVLGDVEQQTVDASQRYPGDMSRPTDYPSMAAQ